MVTRPILVPVDPDPRPVTGGPANYVAGTQVNWQFNNRSHALLQSRLRRAACARGISNT